MAEREGQGREANPILANALEYYAERRTMNNPKGWDHVLRIVNHHIENGDIKASLAHVDEARQVLHRLVEWDKAHDAEIVSAALWDVVSLRRNYQVRAEHWPEPRAQWSDIVADLDRIIGRRGDVIR